MLLGDGTGLLVGTDGDIVVFKRLGFRLSGGIEIVVVLSGFHHLLGGEFSAFIAIIGVALPTETTFRRAEDAFGIGVVVILSPFVHAPHNDTVSGCPVGFLAELECLSRENLAAVLNVVESAAAGNEAFCRANCAFSVGVIIRLADFQNSSLQDTVVIEIILFSLDGIHSGDKMILRIVIAGLIVVRNPAQVFWSFRGGRVFRGCRIFRFLFLILFRILLRNR